MDMVCPWDWWLRFRCPQSENAYMARMHEWMSSLDRSLLGVGIVYALSRMVSCEASGWNFLAHQVGHAIIIVGSALLYWCSVQRLGPYSPSNFKGRMTLLTFIRIGASCIDAIVMAMADDPTKVFNTDHTLLRIITHTSIAPAMLEGIAFRLPFRRHAVLHGVVSFFGLSWIVRFQSECAVNQPLTNAINQIGYMIEEVLIRISVMGFPLDRPPPLSGEYPCWLVGGFWHAFLVFLLPMAVVYFSELKSRIEYLKTDNIPQNIDANGFRMFFWTSVIEKLLICIIATQASWFTFKGLWRMKQSYEDGGNDFCVG